MTPRLTRELLEAALPDVTADVDTAGLSEPVDVCRDAWGIPHLRAANERDAFFAQGFVTAQDRLWHMDYDRARALGCWSRFAGPKGLTEDRMMRTFGLARASKADYDVSSPAARAMLDAYAAGVNAFIATTSTLPVEYQLVGATPAVWEPWHCIAVYKVRNMLMGTYEMKLWRARLALKLGAAQAAPLFRGYPDDSLVAVPPGEFFGEASLACLDELASAARELNWLDEIDGGSNAWVIGGERTKSGKPLVAGDSHRGLDTPNVYYQVHMTCPQFRVSGFALPGVPGAPHFSHTAYVGWGMTHGFGDYQDLYIERFRTEDGVLEYEFEGAWHAADVRQERIDVRGGESVRLPVVCTRHGPVITGDPRAGYGITFRHTGTSAGTAWPDTVHDLLTARNADEAEAALREWTEPVNNFVYADVDGEFGYRYRGRIPVRNMANAWVPVPGWTGANEWHGQIPFEELPHARNPAAGFVVTCNNAPTTADYPHYLNTYFAPDTRARRITKRLGELPAGRADIDEMASVHADCISIPAQALVRYVALLKPTDPQVARARDVLLAWDCRMDRDAAGAAIYGATRTQMLADIVESALGDLASEALGTSGIGRGAATHVGQIFARAVRAMEQGDDSALTGGLTWPAQIESALTRAVAELSERLGDDMTNWSWGAVHHTRPQHPLSRIFPDCADLLDPPPVVTHGDADTPLAGAYSSADRFVQTLMSVNRYIHDPSDWRRSRWIVPLGASGHAGSPHYADQASLWADVATVPQLWDWDDIIADAETRQRLLPR
jgi:penicillin amidase